MGRRRADCEVLSLCVIEESGESCLLLLSIAKNSVELLKEKLLIVFEDLLIFLSSSDFTRFTQFPHRDTGSGDAQRFSSIKKSISYCGLCGAEKSSANTAIFRRWRLATALRHEVR